MSPILSHSIATVPENVASLWIAVDKGNAPRSDTLNRVGERSAVVMRNVRSPVPAAVRPNGCDEKRTGKGRPEKKLRLLFALHLDGFNRGGGGFRV
jgi:hypothetical protein